MPSLQPDVTSPGTAWGQLQPSQLCPAVMDAYSLSLHLAFVPQHVSGHLCLSTPHGSISPGNFPGAPHGMGVHLQPQELS